MRLGRLGADAARFGHPDRFFGSVQRWQQLDLRERGRLQRGCAKTASEQQVPQLVQQTRFVTKVEARDGILVFILPETVVAPVLDVSIVIEPWPASFYAKTLLPGAKCGIRGSGRRPCASRLHHILVTLAAPAGTGDCAGARTAAASPAPSTSTPATSGCRTGALSRRIAVAAERTLPVLEPQVCPDGTLQLGDRPCPPPPCRAGEVRTPKVCASSSPAVPTVRRCRPTADARAVAASLPRRLAPGRGPRLPRAGAALPGRFDPDPRAGLPRAGAALP